MPVDFLPKREIDLLHWSANYRAGIAISPHELGLTQQLADEYAAVQEQFAEAYRVATEPSTRTQPSVRAKEDAEKALRKASRRLAAIVRATPSVSDTQRMALGLSVNRAGGYRSPVGPPKDAPGIHVVSITGRTVRVRVYDTHAAGRRGKPHGCAGVMFQTFIGETAPADPLKWRLHGQTGKTVHDIRFGAAVEPGTKVWIVARWLSPRGESGPPSAAIVVHIQDGLAKAA